MTQTTITIGTRVHRLAHTALRGPRGPAGADGPPGPPGDPASVTPEAVQSALSADQAAGRAALALGTAATRNVGTTAGTVAAGDDPRLSDARTPTAHTHPSTDISDSTVTGRAVLTAADAATARTAIDAPSSAQLAAVSDVADAALPKAGGTITGETTHAVLGEIQRSIAVAGGSWWEAVGKGDQFAPDYYRVGLSVDAAPLPLSASWVFGVDIDGGGTFVTRVSISSPKYMTQVKGRGNSEILAWRGDGTNFAGTCVVGHDYNYAPPGTQPNHTHLAFGPADGSEMCVRDSLGEIKTRIDMSGTLRTRSNITPITDLGGSCGDASRRWTQVHAQDGTIQTSDARLKSAVEPLSPALTAIGLQCARETGRFKWLARIAEVGEAARWHIGITSQRVAEIFALHGEDAYAYGIVCHDEWPERTEIVTPAEYEQRDTGTLDEHGMPVYETVETKPAVTRTIPAGDAYSLRYDELSRLIAAAMIAQQDALEARIEALEGGA